MFAMFVFLNMRLTFRTVYCMWCNLHSSTKHVTFSNRKISVAKNNFVHKDKKIFDERNRIASADLMYIENETRTKKFKMKQKSIPILYKGEILYGIHPVYLALLEKKRQLFQLFIKVQEENCLKTEKNERLSQIDNIARTLEIPIHYVDSKVMNYLAPGAVHQGVCLDAGSLPKLEWQDIECIVNEEASSNLPLWLVLNEIVDPMNVGAIIRSAKYFGINNLFVMKGSSCKLSPTVSKASSGALEAINIYQIGKLEHFLQVKKTQGWNIVSTVAYCENECKTSKEIKDVSDLRISKPTILILGNEGKGIPFEIQMLCDTFVSIYPTQNLHSGIDSLNVSVAAGIILYSISSKIKSYSI